MHCTLPVLLRFSMYNAMQNATLTHWDTLFNVKIIETTRLDM